MVVLPLRRLVRHSGASAGTRPRYCPVNTLNAAAEGRDSVQAHNQGAAVTPPVIGRATPVVPGNVIGSPRWLRTAR